MTIEDGNHPLSGVREGMQVVDSDGAEVGEVAELQMGDPQAVTADGQVSGSDVGLLGGALDVFTDDRSTSPSAENRLARVGYLRVDARGWFSGDRYVASDQVASVEGDVVRLSVLKDQLLD